MGLLQLPPDLDPFWPVPRDVPGQADEDREPDGEEGEGGAASGPPTPLRQGLVELAFDAWKERRPRT